MCREMTAFTSCVDLTGRFKDTFKFRDCNALAEKVNQLELGQQNSAQLLKKQSLKAEIKLCVSTDFKAHLKATQASCTTAVEITASASSFTFRNIWCLLPTVEGFNV